jgi:hypothetical protein
MSVSQDELIVGLALIALLAGTFAFVRLRVDRQPVVLFDLALREGVVADVAAFVRFFRSLQVLARPGWRGVLFGQPWVAFEFRSDDGALYARCAAPARQAQLVSALLHSAVSGIETSIAK